MAKQEERVFVAEILDPVPPEVERDLTSREWILDRGEDVEGQGYRWVGNTEEDVEGQGYRWLRPADEDAEGQGFKYGGVGNTEEDVEGQGYRYTGLRPIEGEDEDVVGLGLRWGLGQTEEDVEGQLVRVRIRPEGEDTSGQGFKWGGLRQTDEDDTEGQMRVRFSTLPS
jgi:hypothetical protein